MGVAWGCGREEVLRHLDGGAGEGGTGCVDKMRGQGGGWVFPLN